MPRARHLPCGPRVLLDSLGASRGRALQIHMCHFESPPASAAGPCRVGVALRRSSTAAPWVQGATRPVTRRVLARQVPFREAD